MDRNEDEVEYQGVDYDATQMAYRAFVETPAIVYEDYFADADSAALVRELVIIVRSISAVRNFDGVGIESICRRLRQELVERDLADVPGAMEWLKLVPMSASDFERFAGVKVDDNSDRLP